MLEADRAPQKLESEEEAHMAKQEEQVEEAARAQRHRARTEAEKLAQLVRNELAKLVDLVAGVEAVLAAGTPVNTAGAALMKQIDQLPQNELTKLPQPLRQQFENIRKHKDDGVFHPTALDSLLFGGEEGVGGELRVTPDTKMKDVKMLLKSRLREKGLIIPEDLGMGMGFGPLTLHANPREREVLDNESMVSDLSRTGDGEWLRIFFRPAAVPYEPRGRPTEGSAAAAYSDPDLEVYELSSAGGGKKKKKSLRRRRKSKSKKSSTLRRKSKKNASKKRTRRRRRR